MEEKSQIAIRSDGVFKQTIRESRIPELELQKVFAGQIMKQLLLPDIIPNTRMMMRGSNDILILRQLSHLTFNTWWQMNDEGNWFPVWLQTDNSVRATFSLDLTFDARLLIQAKKDEGTWSMTNVYTFIKSGNLLYVPPFPNIFPEGRFCMDVASSELATKYPWKIVEQVEHGVQETPWNKDLLNEQKIEVSIKLLQFSSSGEYISNPAGWDTLIPTLNPFDQFAEELERMLS